MRTRLEVGHLAEAGQGSEASAACSFQLAAPDPATSPGKGAILVVAGAADGGEGTAQTGRLAADLVRDHYYATPSDYPVEALRQAMIAADVALHEAASSGSRRAAQVLCAVVQEGLLIVGRAGEGQAYLWHDGHLSALTGDDRPAARVVQVAPGPGERTPSNLAAGVSEMLGAGARVEPLVRTVGKLADGDRLLLCTEGLADAVDAATMAAVLSQHAPQAACEKLASASGRAGAMLVARVHLELELAGERKPAGIADAGSADVTLSEHWPALEARESALAEMEQDLLARQYTLEARERVLAERECQLEELDAALRATGRAVAEREQRPLDPRPTPAGSERPVGLPALAGARARYEWTCEIAYAAPSAGEFEEERTVQLPDGRTVICALAVRREHLRRQYPVAVEAYARCGEHQAARLLVGYGLDLGTLAADLLSERRLTIVAAGDETIGLGLGDVMVYAALARCQFATVAAQQVAREGTAFLAVAVRFHIAIDARV